MDAFNKAKANTLAQHRPYNLKINLEGDSIPLLGQIYSMSQAKLKILWEFLADHIAAGFIRPSQSLHRVPVIFSKKKDSSLHLCVDFHGLNKITKKDRYPLPLIANWLGTPGKEKIYTKINLQHAYHLVHIAEGDEWKTAFRTHYGSFEWVVMPFRLTNAPATFQRFMNDIFSDMVNVFVVVYLDDILIYSNNINDHHTHVQEVLCCLQKNGLYAGVPKCTFHADMVKYLGYILFPTGLMMDSAKVQVIKNWPEPRKVKDIQSFLGFANFYRWFIHTLTSLFH